MSETKWTLIISQIEKPEQRLIEKNDHWDIDKNLCTYLFVYSGLRPHSVDLKLLSFLKNQLFELFLAKNNKLIFVNFIYARKF